MSKRIELIQNAFKTFDSSGYFSGNISNCVLCYSENDDFRATNSIDYFESDRDSHGKQSYRASGYIYFNQIEANFCMDNGVNPKRRLLNDF